MLKVGLVGAGPWAQMFHGPLLAMSDQIEFVGIWARRPEAAQQLATTFGTKAFDELDDLFAAVDAVAFCVPPNVQAELAARAANAGKHLLLEKPLAWDLAGAEELVATIEKAGVTSQMVLTNRYRADLPEFLEQVKTIEPIGAVLTWINGAILDGGPFATPWRQTEGALLDVGPHALDLLDAALGPIVDVKAHGSATSIVTLVLTHESGVQSTATFSVVVPEGGTSTSQFFGHKGSATLGAPNPDMLPAALALIASQFVAAIESGTEHPLSARRGLYLQGLIEQANSQLA